MVPNLQTLQIIFLASHCYICFFQISHAVVSDISIDNKSALV